MFGGKKKVNNTQQTEYNTAAGQDNAVVLTGSTFVQQVEIADTDALRVAGDISGAAVAAVRQTGLDAIKTAGSLGRDAFSLGRDSLDLGKAALYAMEGSSRDAFDLARDVTLGTTAEVRRAAGESLAMAEGATKSALAFASQATRSDTSQALENIAKWAAIAAAAVAVLSFFTRRQPA